MQPPIKSEEEKFDCTMEENLAKVGAKIDDLIEKAGETRKEIKLKLDELNIKKESTLKKSEEALDEFKVALDSAWADLNEAWQDVKLGAERAAQKFHSK